MSGNTTRLSVEIPSNLHKKLKILANANGLTLREFILAVLEPILHPKKKLNKTTKKAIEDTEKGIGLKTYKNIDQMWEDLGLNE
jgi:hypothetical protein